MPPTFAVTGCTYCYSAADLASLTGPPDQVADRMVMSVVMEERFHRSDFPGLLHRLAPRILRKLVHGELPVDEGRTGDQFVAAGWASWPREQRDAINDLPTTSWHLSLERHPSGMPVHDMLEFRIVTSRQVRPWLEAIEGTTGRRCGRANRQAGLHAAHPLNPTTATAAPTLAPPQATRHARTPHDPLQPIVMTTPVCPAGIAISIVRKVLPAGKS